IFIDDGSHDGSFKELLEIKEENSEMIKLIKFTRNFGQLPAIYAGYSAANGDIIVSISADLQDPPELINQMINSYLNQRYEIVICSRQSRDEKYFRQKTSYFFYNIIKRLSFKNMPSGGFDFVLISKKVKNVLLKMEDTNPFWQGQILWTGYKIKIIPYNRKKREIGTSKWTFSKKIKYLIDGVLSYSYFPLRLMSLLGLLFFTLGIRYSLYIVFAYFVGDVPFKGWAPIVILILVLSGIQMLMLGIIGEYLWRTLDQVRNRPPYVIEKIYD
ncbi:MAG: glycosyltransferase family 2 protein, partial [Bacteroidales bacterium]|nr:glycosyltransferase family 2 protein [Bacteroidales bacterium]